MVRAARRALRAVGAAASDRLKAVPWTGLSSTASTPGWVPGPVARRSTNASRPRRSGACRSSGEWTRKGLTTPSSTACPRRKRWPRGRRAVGRPPPKLLTS
eukprot:4422825-Lingulodinium_polyedra.AAC.2